MHALKANCRDKGPRGQRPFELPDELFQVVLHYPVEIDQLAVDVVEHLHLGGLLQEEKSRAAGKGLDVAGMVGKLRNDVAGKPALATNLRDEMLKIGLGFTCWVDTGREPWP